MNQEQLMKVKIKYLEDRINTLEKSLSRINNILGRFQMTEDKQSNDPFIRVMEQGESDDNGNIAIITDEREQELKSKDNDNELI